MMATDPAYQLQGQAPKTAYGFTEQADYNGASAGVTDAYMDWIILSENTHKEVEKVEVPGNKTYEGLI